MISVAISKRRMFLVLFVSIAVYSVAQKKDVDSLAKQLRDICPAVDSVTARNDANILVKTVWSFRQEKIDAQAAQLITEADNTLDRIRYHECIEKAVQLGSYEGLTRLAEWYQLQAADEARLSARQKWFDKAKECYQRQQEQFGKSSDDERFIPDFYKVLDSGDTLYFRLIDGINERFVSVCTPAKFRCNVTGSRLVIPDEVDYQEHSYLVKWIDENAFNSDFALQHIIMPRHLTYIGLMAFKNCFKLDTIVFTGDKLALVENAAFPSQTKFIFPDSMSMEMIKTIKRLSTFSQQANSQSIDEKWNAAKWMVDLLARSILDLMPRGRYCTNRDYDELVNVPSLNLESLDTLRYISVALESYVHMVRKVMSLGVTNYQYYTLPQDLMYHTYRDTLHHYRMLGLRPFVLLHRQMADTDTTTMSLEQLACYHQIEMVYSNIEKNYFNRYEGKDKDIVEALLLRHRNPRTVEAEYGVDGVYIEHLLTPKKKEEQ